MWAMARCLYCRLPRAVRILGLNRVAVDVVMTYLDTGKNL